MAKQKMNHADYYLGLDVGTNSVGWAITDTNYELVKVNKKDLWGVRLFDTAQTAANRRLNRAARRRQQRKIKRLRLLQEIFQDKIEETDPLFFKRLAESSYHLPDKTHDSRTSLFNDDGFTDEEFHHQFRTMFHLRSSLIHTPEKTKDLRFVYLATHHILKNRGHFLFQVESLDVISTIDTLVNTVKEQVSNTLQYSLEIQNCSAAELGNILKIKRKTDSKKQLQNILILTNTLDEEIGNSPKKY
ncbi:MAG: type II CRISPR RNA-guided endonuclease Cas9 [Sphaerochaetaceae bacterium]